ncbi:MAG: hypothetical protein ACE5QV_02815, partial [Fidelibacterota bacterium]
PLPTNFTFGLAINAVEAHDQKMSVSFSAVKPNDGQPLGQVGSEWNYRDVLSIRTGYRLNHDVATYSFGGGINMDISGYNLRFDYSYSDWQLLRAAHRFGVSLAF